MDGVQACMDTLEPWLSVSDGGVSLSSGALNGFTGGAFGAISTIAFTQLKKDQVKERLECNYCGGTGQILCGWCAGSGKLTAEGGSKESCANCEDTGTVVCINCQGSGVSVPEEFFQALGEDEIGFTEEDYIGLFDGSPPGAAGSSGSSGPAFVDAAAASRAKEAAAAAAAAPASADADAQPNDYTGGLG